MVTKTIIKAGGGLVINPEGEFLMIFRRGHWDLPKGKLEAEETIERCALREVCEECGINNLKLGALLCVTEHNYIENEHQAIKQTTWFAMSGSGSPTAQSEEDIECARWVPRVEVGALLQNTYPTIIEVFAAAGFRYF